MCHDMLLKCHIIVVVVCFCVKIYVFMLVYFGNFSNKQINKNSNFPFNHSEEDLLFKLLLLSYIIFFLLSLWRLMQQTVRGTNVHTCMYVVCIYVSC